MEHEHGEPSVLAQVQDASGKYLVRVAVWRYPDCAAYILKIY